MRYLTCFPLRIGKRHGSSQEFDWIVAVELPAKYLIKKAGGVKI